MKRLYVVRHADSSWDNKLLSDFDRPLSKQGRIDSRKIADHFVSQNYKLNSIVHSSALRTSQTADLLYKTINVDKKINLYHEKSLYDANNTTVINVINKYLSNFNNLMIVGHNPSITQFVNYISNATIDHVPSGGMAVIDFQENILDELTGELIDFIYPKKLKHT